MSRWGDGAILAALGLFIMIIGALAWRQSRPRTQQGSLRRQLPAQLFGQGEELLVATSALSGPPFVLFWAPFAVGGSMMLAAELVGDWLGVAGIATVGLAVPLALVVWRPVGVALTDRRLVLSRVTRFGRFRRVLLDVSRSHAAACGFQQGMVTWGAVELLVRVDDAVGHAPVRLIFWRRLSQRHGLAIHAALSHPEPEDMTEGGPTSAVHDHRRS